MNRRGRIANWPQLAADEPLLVHKLPTTQSAAAAGTEPPPTAIGTLKLAASAPAVAVLSAGYSNAMALRPLNTSCQYHY